MLLEDAAGVVILRAKEAVEDIMRYLSTEAYFSFLLATEFTAEGRILNLNINNDLILVLYYC